MRRLGRLDGRGGAGVLPRDEGAGHRQLRRHDPPVALQPRPRGFAVEVVGAGGRVLAAGVLETRGHPRSRRQAMAPRGHRIPSRVQTEPRPNPVGGQPRVWSSSEVGAGRRDESPRQQRASCEPMGRIVRPRVSDQRQRRQREADEKVSTVAPGHRARVRKPGEHAGRRPNGDAKPIYMNGAQAGTRKHTKRLADGTMEDQTYTVPVLANPGNVIEVIVGGGVMGHPLAHENEAPFPEKLPEFFIKSFCPPGGRVLDPFSGSGTTVAVAQRLGRIGYGCDLRMSQCELGRRRLATPFAKKTKAKKAAPEPKGEPLLWGVA
jgi:hypothetical protein